MIYGAILAGGIGSRMKSARIPKQFMKIGGRPIIIWTLARMQKDGLFDEIVIAIHPEWQDYLEELIGKWRIDTGSLRIIHGGKERLDSIENVINDIEMRHGIREEDKIVIHDAVRPFITREILENSIQALDAYPAVVAATPSIDTMLWIETGTKVDSMPDRSKLFNGQAPDSFRLPVLKDSLDSLTEEERRTITGTAQICLVRGIDIHTVPGDQRNMKLTTDEDLMIAEGLIREELATGMDRW